MGVTVVPATAEHVGQVEQILGRTSCWCTYYRMTASEYGRVSAADHAAAVRVRRSLLRSLLADDVAPGMLALNGRDAVGWCGLGRRSELPRLLRSRTIPRVHDDDAWCIVCFLGEPGVRRRGVAAALLRGATTYAASAGAIAIEGYPIDPRGERVNTADAYVGTVSMFADAGFAVVGETRATAAGLPRWVVRRELVGPHARSSTPVRRPRAPRGG